MTISIPVAERGERPIRHAESSMDVLRTMLMLSEQLTYPLALRIRSLVSSDAFVAMPVHKQAWAVQMYRLLHADPDCAQCLGMGAKRQWKLDIVTGVEIGDGVVTCDCIHHLLQDSVLHARVRRRDECAT